MILPINIAEQNLPNVLELCQSCCEIVTQCFSPSCKIKVISVDQVEVIVLSAVCKLHTKEISDCKINKVLGFQCCKCSKWILSANRADCIDLLEREVSFCSKCYLKELKKPISKKEEAMFQFLVESSRRGSYQIEKV